MHIVPIFRLCENISFKLIKWSQFETHKQTKEHDLSLDPEGEAAVLLCTRRIVKYKVTRSKCKIRVGLHLCVDRFPIFIEKSSLSR